MIADALDGDRLIGMVLLRQGWERDYDGRPPVYPIGCSGVITHAEKQGDGRYNLVLRGLERFRIVEEDHSRSYRRAAVDPLRESGLTPEDRDSIRNQRSKLEALLAPAVEKSGADSRTTAMSDEDLVNALAQYLALEPLEKQALLELQGLRSRAESLVELLEMKIMMSRTPRVSNLAH
jgi:Lon protease-like protein